MVFSTFMQHTVAFYYDVDALFRGCIATPAHPNFENPIVLLNAVSRECT